MVRPTPFVRSAWLTAPSPAVDPVAWARLGLGHVDNRGISYGAHVRSTKYLKHLQTY